MTDTIADPVTVPAPPSAPVSRAALWRPLLRAILIMVVIGIAAGAVILWIVGDPTRLEGAHALLASPIGLVILFVLSALATASMFLPAPAFALVVVGATVFDPITIGVVTALGQTVGELTAYYAGRSGRALLPSGRRATKVIDLMRRRGNLILFILAVTPNPIFDAGGALAGALGMRLRTFLVVVSAGRAIKNVTIAMGALLLLDELVRLAA